MSISPLEARVKCSAATLRCSLINFGSYEPKDGQACCGVGKCYVQELARIKQPLRVASMICFKAAQKRTKAVEMSDMEALHAAVKEHEEAKDKVVALIKEMEDEQKHSGRFGR